MISEHLYSSITDQFRRHEAHSELNKKKANNVYERRSTKKIHKTIRSETSSEEKKQNDLNFETGAYSWLTTQKKKKKVHSK